jgi:hypothetical protein
MNYIKHLASFFDRVSADERLNPTHVSMYVSLFQFWNANRFQNPISISRNELMKVSKISAKATYHKCMKELNEWQYLKYKPSYNPFKGSLVYLFNSQPSNEQALIAHRTKIGTSIEQAQEPYININKHNKQNIINGEQIKKRKKENFCDLKKKEKSCVKKEMPTAFEDAKKNTTNNPQKGSNGKYKQQPIPFSEEAVIPITHESEMAVTFKELLQYFKSQKYPSVEAEKFFNYFQSIGWLVGGKTKMKDWKAAADNWIINAKKFAQKHRPPKAKNLHTNQNKNYNEPL